MANGVLASYQSATTKYTNAYVDPASNPNGLVRADFPMYTVPSATPVSYTHLTLPTNREV